MWFGIVTVFPEMLRSVFDYGVVGRSIREGNVEVTAWNPRDFAKDKHRTIDDRPYGGGPGMLLKVQPLRDAIDAAKKASGNTASVIYLSPQGRVLDQAGVVELVERKKIILVSGRYEGIDERIIDSDIDEQWSVGDFVLSGGELAAMIFIDAISRFIPGTLNHEESVYRDSFCSFMLDYPQYTRPVDVDGQKVPEVLIGGDHKKISQWRLKQALGRTWLMRPDLLKGVTLSTKEIKLLNEFQKEYNSKL